MAARGTPDFRSWRRTVVTLAALLVFGGYPTTWARAELSPEDALWDERHGAVPPINSTACRQGLVAINQDVALDVPGRYCLLGAQEARRVLTELWNNPPLLAADVEGLLLPRTTRLEESPWAAVVRYTALGHVDDSDAATLDFGDVLHALKVANLANMMAQAQNRSRILRIDSWAASPTYDAAAHTLFLPVRLDAGDREQSRLNYSMRKFGRHGALGVSVAAAIGTLNDLAPEMRRISDMVRFSEGSRYSDHKPGEQVAVISLRDTIFARHHTSRRAAETQISLGEVIGLAAFAMLGIAIAIYAYARFLLSR